MELLHDLGLRASYNEDDDDTDDLDEDDEEGDDKPDGDEETMDDGGPFDESDM